MMAGMIPVPLPSASFFFLMAASFCALAGLACWLGLLAVGKPVRRAFRASPVKHGVSLAVVLLLSGPALAYLYFTWEIEREFAREEAARRMTLAQAARVGAIDMPAGTRLTLRRAGAPETFTLAEFPRPVAVGGVQATRVARELTDEYDETSHDIAASYPTSLAATGAGVQAVDGWRCDASRGVTFDTARDGASTRMAHCVLADGNAVAMPRGRDRSSSRHGDGAGEAAMPAADDRPADDRPIALPAGTELRATDGNRYVDGFTDADRWEIEAPAGTVLRVAGLAVLDALIRLDGERRYFELSRGTLPCDLALGEMRYAAGARIRSAPRNWRDTHPDAWVFSPWDGIPARREGHADVGGTQSVVQAPDGAVLAVVDSESVGIFRYPEIIVDPAPAKPPAVQCPVAKD
ncbi:hypothetical protein CAL29_04180 [Bordetella genomosp. 10]|uniref:Uncharacterized protein n=2 Tax=Bordetella genomosp. 10 TaxID=1416804 RepID=A0A261SJM1_9BORD|nr:hypothetical protein CAL29_04180 [Bordetella genomosp. 10]